MKYAIVFDLSHLKEVCTAIAVGLHYMFLTDFCLMLAEGIQIVRMVVIVFSTRSIVHWLLPLCWGECRFKRNGYHRQWLLLTFGPFLYDLS